MELPAQCCAWWFILTCFPGFINYKWGFKTNALYWENWVEAYGQCLNPAAQGVSPTWLWNTWLLGVQGEDQNKKTQLLSAPSPKLFFQTGCFPSWVNSSSPNTAFTFELLAWWSSLRQQSWTFALHRKELYVTTVLISANNGWSRPGKRKATGHLLVILFTHSCI